jgi:hypothetical protein
MYTKMIHTQKRGAYVKYVPRELPEPPPSTDFFESELKKC